MTLGRALTLSPSAVRSGRRLLRHTAAKALSDWCQCEPSPDSVTLILLDFAPSALGR
jgi:hypothetical protein